MKLLAINGSPRKKGNTSILLDAALKGAHAAGADTATITLSNLAFSPCGACDTPSDNGICTIDDAVTAELKAVRSADAIIMASPIYFGSLSAQLKAFIDRFQCFWRAQEILQKKVFPQKRPGAFFAVQAAQREDFFLNARFIIRHAYQVIGVEYKHELFCMHCEAKGDVLKYQEYIDSAYDIGRRLCLRD